MIRWSSPGGIDAVFAPLAAQERSSHDNKHMFIYAVEKVSKRGWRADDGPSSPSPSQPEAPGTGTGYSAWVRPGGAEPGRARAARPATAALCRGNARTENPHGPTLPRHCDPPADRLGNSMVSPASGPKCPMDFFTGKAKRPGTSGNPRPKEHGQGGPGGKASTVCANYFT